jgi:nucleotidyltransferase substrate binding protein (TIGR01987 family)
MSNETRWRQRYANFQKALTQLEEAVEMEAYSNLEMQGLIQCFEYTIELAWKTLQDIIHAKGYDEISGPKPVIKQAFKDGYITDDEAWLEMWNDRLKTSHTYDQEEAEAIVENIKHTYYFLFDALDKRLATEPETF